MTGPMVVSILSVLIATLALLGVIASLLLQMRQLRASQLEASRSAMIEIVKLLIGEPALFMDPTDTLYTDPDSFRRELSLNLYFKYLEMSYSVGAVSRASVRNQAGALFRAEYRRRWWDEVAREHWRVEASTKSEREFFTLVDQQWARVEAATAPPAGAGPPGSP